MQTAILFFIASSIGVTAGWQPMPDGSPRYEYVVQLDRELLDTLKRGDSIPISSEVPDEIRPIARIRILVGDENLPRETLASSSHEKQSREGLVEAQYILPVDSKDAGPRYENQPLLPAASQSRQILPPDSQSKSSGESFGQSLQRTAEEARDASTQGQILPPSNEILPPNKQILPPKSDGRYAEPIRTANETQDNQWGDAGSSRQADIQKLFGPVQGETNRGNLQPVEERSIVTGNRYDSTPRDNGAISPSTQQILPPGRSPITPGTPSSSMEVSGTISPPTTGPRYQPRDESTTVGDSRDWTQSPPSSSTATSTPGVFNAPWPAPERFEDAPLAQQWNARNQSDDRLASRPTETSSAPEWPKTETKVDSFDVAHSNDNSSAGDSGSSLSFPSRPVTETSTDTASDSQRPNSPPPIPEIRRDMLDAPANAELQNASGEPVKPTPASPPKSTDQLATTTPLPSTVVSLPQTTAPTASSSSGPVFPLLLAWVLLSGSGAGNLYLFWSYLDIRNKYRGLIRTAGRKLGRRAVDEGYDEYED